MTSEESNEREDRLFPWLFGIFAGIGIACLYASSQGADAPILFIVMLLTIPPFSIGTIAAIFWAWEKLDESSNSAAASTSAPVEYGDPHQRERAKYADVIRVSGGTCSERRCIKETRTIAPGSKWHLAHDHQLGGHNYLGPAHPECNEFEALLRGVKRGSDWKLTRNQALDAGRRLGLDESSTRTLEDSLGLNSPY